MFGQWVLPLSAIDDAKYVVRVRLSKGLVTLRRRWGEREELQDQFDEVASFMASDEKFRKFTYTCSGKLSLHTSGTRPPPVTTKRTPSVRDIAREYSE